MRIISFYILIEIKHQQLLTATQIYSIFDTDYNAYEVRKSLRLLVYQKHVKKSKSGYTITELGNDFLNEHLNTIKNKILL